jgi:glyoxylase-like metal-dependent hydrolase (beta-lactamase superfamily II)
MKSGNFQIDVVDTGLFALDGGAMFGVVPKPLWSKAYNTGDDKNRIPLASKPLLIRWDKKVVLVDTGNGTKYNDKFVKIYDIDLHKSDMDLALSKFNLSTSDITDVILTHLHFDHTGGATKLVNGNIEPTFPNAKYYVQKEQYEWALNPTEKDRASFMNDNYVPLKEEGILELIDGEGSLFDFINLIPVFGHTKAMQMIEFNTGEHNFLYPSDLSPTAAHIKTPFVMGYDNFPLTTIEEKKKYFPKAYEQDTIIILEHDAFRQAIKIHADKNKFEMKDEIIITD